MLSPSVVSCNGSGSVQRWHAFIVLEELLCPLLFMCPLCVCPRGVRQVEGARARLEDNLYEMSKPLTRTEDDVDRENLLKDQVRAI